MTKVRAATVAGLLIAAAAVTFVVQRHSWTKLRVENLSLLEQTIRLSATNEVLSNFAAQADSAGPGTSNQLQELLNLRAEVARLQADSAELAQSNTAAQKNDPAYRAALLKQRLDEMPDKKIPELELLTDRDWRLRPNLPLETDADFRAAFAWLRQTAKQNFARQLGIALHLYVQTNDGRLPTDLLELKPFLSSPVDDAVFQRYELKQTGKLSDVPHIEPESAAGVADSDQRPTVPKTEPVIIERAPVDEQYDSLFTIGVYGYTYERFGRGTGSGAGGWTRIGKNGLPEVILPR